jgi:hypothetical protein
MKILLDAITEAAKNKEVTIDEVVGSFNEGSETKYEPIKIGEKQIVKTQTTQPIIQQTYVDTRNGKVSSNQELNHDHNANTFNPLAVIGGIGAFILAIGTGILIGNNWQTMSTNQQLFSSLGIGLILFYLSYFLSYRYKDNVISNIMIVISGFWLTWGLQFTVDKTVTDQGSKIITFAVITTFLAIIYGIMYKYFGKSLYFMALSAIGLLSFLMYINYSIINSDPESYSKTFALGLIVASTSGLCLLAYSFRQLTSWVRDLVLMGEYAVFTVSTFSYFVYLNRWWVNGSETVAEFAYSIFFGVWYWIAIKTQSRVLLIVNSIAVYIYLFSFLASKYFGNSNFAYSLILGGLGLILMALGTYYISTNMKSKVKVV